MAKGFFIWRGVCTDVNISSILYPINPAFELNVGSKVYDAFEDKKLYSSCFSLYSRHSGKLDYFKIMYLKVGSFSKDIIVSKQLTILDIIEKMT